ncbi:putative glycosyltransferase 7 [Silene latifolia]|uniref:putative glycosyltransferase 7 n=1 Tax=Silene latifolia TaxID=37657 RepID=UPI003D76BAC7
MLEFSRVKQSSRLSDGIMFLSGVLVALIILWTNPSVSNLSSNPDFFLSPAFKNPASKLAETNFNQTKTNLNLTTFYDDPEFGYTMDKKIKNWDEKRRQWLEANPSYSGSVERIVMVTGSQPTQCKNPIGDHLMLRLFKNKVDYCRIHGHDIFYNNVLLHQGMHGYWAKYPLVKAAMLAHPEAEWIWWVDSDAVVTDMDFVHPLEKYKDYNLIAYGLLEGVIKHKGSMMLNAGVFLIRNCQWSMDILERWANFGPQSENYAKWGEIQASVFVDKQYPVSDDQAALCYMILMEKEIWGNKIYLENEYYFQGYWEEIVAKFENVTRRYSDLATQVSPLRSRHAEKAGEKYQALWQKYLDGANTNGFAYGSWRRPFVTHFTGCEPCSGDHNPSYTKETCEGNMVKALNFGDNQVLRNFGYTRHNLTDSSSVEPL